jgi:NAD(P)-dependent dehydrogenase (short-subunit alcohol dehydrogenase family)
MDLGLQDAVALVVGGAGYVGAAVSARLREEGATVVVASRSSTGDGTTSIGVDARDVASVGAAVSAVLAVHGRIDVLVVTAAPSAGTLDPARLTDPELVLDAVDGKAMVFLRLANAVLPHMRERAYGRIVVVSGQNGMLTGNLAGAVRNAATTVAAKNLADAAAGSGVAVNVVNPGNVVDEPGPDVATGAGGESSPQQIAALIAFLASPLSPVSGETIATGHRVRGVTAL